LLRGSILLSGVCRETPSSRETETETGAQGATRLCGSASSTAFINLLGCVSVHFDAFAGKQR